MPDGYSSELLTDLWFLKQNKELTSDRDDINSKFEDLNDQVEISLLDKEVAEERFEAAESALEQMKERAAELEVEVNVLREENGEQQSGENIASWMAS